ncbi:hypothetical protein ACH3XW_44540 [Acanthocheilonema viteae]
MVHDIQITTQPVYNSQKFRSNNNQGLLKLGAKRKGRRQQQSANSHLYRPFHISFDLSRKFAENLLPSLTTGNAALALV